MTLLEQPEQVSHALLRWLGFKSECASANGAAAMEN
jgi:hypothetical protein